jgi:hypothetical protein
VEGDLIGIRLPEDTSKAGSWMYICRNEHPYHDWKGSRLQRCSFSQNTNSSIYMIVDQNTNGSGSGFVMDFKLSPIAFVLCLFWKRYTCVSKYSTYC